MGSFSLSPSAAADGGVSAVGPFSGRATWSLEICLTRWPLEIDPWASPSAVGPVSAVGPPYPTGIGPVLLRTLRTLWIGAIQIMDSQPRGVASQEASMAEGRGAAPSLESPGPSARGAGGLTPSEGQNRGETSKAAHPSVQGVPGGGQMGPEVHVVTS